MNSPSQLDKYRNAESVDLANVDYDDILHLYRGWKKSEGALKEKNKELHNLKERVKQLQDSHAKFRGQIQALESVKELTLSLQSQVSILQQENAQLNQENKDLSDLNAQAEELLKERLEEETKQSKLLRDIQLEFERMRGRYEETMRHQKNLEIQGSDEQALRMSCESKLTATEKILEACQAENRSLKSQLDQSNLRTVQFDNELAHASEQLSSLTKEVSDFSTAKEKLSIAQTEIGVLKGDIARLLRLLEHFPAAKSFIRQWEDGNGLSFIGVSKSDQEVFGKKTPSKKASNSIFDEENYLDSGDQLLNSSKVNDTLDSDLKAKKLLSLDITPSYLMHLKRVHPSDPFPLTSSLDEEQLYWVPREACQTGIEFLTTKLPHAPPEVIMEFLRKMNRVWMRREKRKIERIKDLYSSQIEEYKRKLSNSKPYRSVIAEREVQRLQSQVKETRKKKLKGRPKNSFEDRESDINHEFFDDQDQMDFEHLPPHQRRPCIIEAWKKAQTMDVMRSISPTLSHKLRGKMGSVEALSQEKLLEASLVSLERLGQHVSISNNASREKEPFSHHGHGLDGDKYPSESFLRGALWLGRNFSVVVEELTEKLEEIRSKHLTEVSTASHDEDLSRRANRLNLLTTSTINNVVSEAHKTRVYARDIIHGANSLIPGDKTSIQAFMATLPIESNLAVSPKKKLQAQ